MHGLNIIFLYSCVTKQVEVGEGNVMEVSQVVAMTVSNMTSVADHLDPVANILEHIVKAGSPSVEV